MNTKNKPQNWDFDYIGCPSEVLLNKLNTSLKGLNDPAVEKRLAEYGFNEPAKKKKRTMALEILSKFINPLVIVLLIIAGFSLFFGEKISAILVILMALISVFLSYIQEHRAGKEAEKLSEIVRTTATVYRNGKQKEDPRLLPLLPRQAPCRVGPMDAGSAPSRRASSPGGADDPQDAADLLQIPAPALGGAQSGGGQDAHNLS